MAVSLLRLLADSARPRTFSTRSRSGTRRSVVTTTSFHDDDTDKGLIDRSRSAQSSRAVRGADHVLTVSERTKRDILERYGVPSRR